jgi:hypothetical protein
MLEVDGNPLADCRLHLAEPPIGPSGVADPLSGLDRHGVLVRHSSSIVLDSSLW